MKPDRPVFRRPDGTPYDPSRFNVRQYEEQYGPGGVPEGYSMAAITPLQSPRLIIAVGVLLVFMAGIMTYGAFGGRKGYYARQVEAEAARQGLTVEEYGVYKGDVGSAVKPINSAGGLLFLSILITICMGAAIVFTVIGIVAGTQEVNWVAVVLGALLIIWLVPTAWAYYFKERKAGRLRKQNGKTIELPTRRNSAKD